MSDSGRQRALIGVLLGVVVLLVCGGSVAAGLFLYNQLKEPASPTFAPAVGDTAVLSEQGLLITRLVPGGPAAMAGLRRGDIILQAAGQPLSDAGQLQQLIWALDAGDELEVEVLRGADTAVYTLTLADTLPRLGMELLGPGTAVPVPAQPRPGPPVVSRVVPGSPAEAAGLAVGDVIVAVDQQALLARDELFTVMQDKHPGDTLTLMLRRGADTLLRDLTLTPHPDDASRGYLGIELQP